MTTENQFDAKTAELSGDHLRFVKGCSLHTLVSRVNGALPGYEKKLASDDLPHVVRVAMAEAQKLALQLEKVDALPMDLADRYVQRQVSLATGALPALVAKQLAVERDVQDGLDTLRKALVGKMPTAGAAAAAGALLDSIHAEAATEQALGVAGWRAAVGVCREVSEGRGVPKYLALLRRQHLAAVNSTPLA
jgi:hypothetical protein